MGCYVILPLLEDLLDCSSAPYSLHAEKRLKHLGGFKEGCYQCTGFYIGLMVQGTGCSFSCIPWKSTVM